jgi:hypothetical protein
MRLRWARPADQPQDRCVYRLTECPVKLNATFDSHELRCSVSAILQGVGIILAIVVTVLTSDCG